MCIYWDSYVILEIIPLEFTYCYSFWHNIASASNYSISVYWIHIRIYYHQLQLCGPHMFVVWLISIVNWSLGSYCKFNIHILKPWQSESTIKAFNINDEQSQSLNTFNINYELYCIYSNIDGSIYSLMLPD